MLGKLVSMLTGVPVVDKRLLKPELVGFDPAAQAALAELAQGQPGAARALLAKTRGDWSRRGLWIDFNRDLPIPALDGWRRRDPRNPDAFLMAGFAKIQWAWEARSSKRAAEVTESQWELFYERLESAQADLERAAELYPEDPTPWAGMLTIRRGRGHDIESISELYREGIARDPVNFRVHKNTILALTQQWGGSHEEMLRQARDAAELAAPGNDLASLIAFGHYYVHFYYQRFDQDDVAAENYLRDPRNSLEVAAAFDRASRTGALPLSSMPSWNYFALWFWLAEDRRRLRQCLELLGGRYSHDPWSSLYCDPPPVLPLVEAMAREAG